MFGTLTEKWLS